MMSYFKMGIVLKGIVQWQKICLLLMKQVKENLSSHFISSAPHTFPAAADYEYLGSAKKKRDLLLFDMYNSEPFQANCGGLQLSLTKRNTYLES